MRELITNALANLQSAVDDEPLLQGCHWSGKSQGNSRSGKSQGILEFVREIWNFVESQGNSKKVREI